MTVKIQRTDVECTADSRSFCAGTHKTVEVAQERDDRNLLAVTCDDCGGEGQVVVGTALGNCGDILAVDGDMELA
jgi:DnaJ-class molecular chaperone